MKKLIALIALVSLCVMTPAWAARSFNGTTDKIILANESNFDFEYNSTFSCFVWVYMVSTYLAQGVVAKIGATSAQKGWTMELHDYVGNSDAVFVRLSNNVVGNVSLIDVTGPDNDISTGQWYHIGFTYNGNNLPSGIKIYENGISKTVTTQVNTLGTQTILHDVPLNLGEYPYLGTPVNFLNGYEADLRVWNVELTADEVKMAMLGAIVRPQNIVTNNPLWGVSSPEPDTGGKNNHGTLTGTARQDHPPVISAEWMQ